jgi:hypothetical protein
MTLKRNEEMCNPPSMDLIESAPKARLTSEVNLQKGTPITSKPRCTLDRYRCFCQILLFQMWDIDLSNRPDSSANLAKAT